MSRRDELGADEEARDGSGLGMAALLWSERVAFRPSPEQVRKLVASRGLLAARERWGEKAVHAVLQHDREAQRKKRSLSLRSPPPRSGGKGFVDTFESTAGFSTGGEKGLAAKSNVPLAAGQESCLPPIPFTATLIETGLVTR